MKKCILSLFVFVVSYMSVSDVFATDENQRISCIGRDNYGEVKISILQGMDDAKLKVNMDVLLIPKGISTEDAITCGMKKNYSNIKVDFEGFLPVYIIRDNEDSELFRVQITKTVESGEIGWISYGKYTISGGYSMNLTCGPAN